MKLIILHNNLKIDKNRTSWELGRQFNWAFVVQMWASDPGSPALMWKAGYCGDVLCTSTGAVETGRFLELIA